MPHGQKHRDPGQVERDMQREAEERRKDEEFIRKHNMDKCDPSKGNCGQSSLTGKMYQDYK